MKRGNLWSSYQGVHNSSGDGESKERGSTEKKGK